MRGEEGWMGEEGRGGERRDGQWEEGRQAHSLKTTENRCQQKLKHVCMDKPVCCVCSDTAVDQETDDLRSSPPSISENKMKMMRNPSIIYCRSLVQLSRRTSGFWNWQACTLFLLYQPILTKVQKWQILSISPLPASPCTNNAVKFQQQ